MLLLLAATPGYRANADAAAAAFDAGKFGQAASLYQQLVAANPVNPGVWKRLADSRYGAGDYADAIAAYQKALELRADQPSYCAYDLARAYAQAGDTTSAMRWLTQAMSWGYPKLEEARADTALARLHGRSDYNSLMGIVDASKMTRTQGWRYDLEFLARYVKVRAYHPFKTTTGDRFVSRALHTESQFDAQVQSIYDRIPRLNDVQIELAFMRLIASLGDGHTELGLGPRPEYVNTLPLKFESFAEGIFITAAEPQYRALVGAQVLAFDGHPTSGVIARMAPYLSRDNDYWIAAFLPQYFRYPALLHGLGIAARSDRVSFRLGRPDGTTTDAAVTTVTDAPYIWNELPSPEGWVNLFDTLPAPAPLYLQKNATNWLTYDAPHKLLYAQYNRVLDLPGETLAQFAAQIQSALDADDVDKLVLDMRWNNGGNTYLNGPLLDLVMRNVTIDRPGHLFIIIGPRTFSAALNSAAYFERNTNAVFVGEPTGGKPNSPGEEWFFSLPYSKVNVSLSNLYWESGWPVDSRWAIAPQIYTPRTFADYLARRDPALDAVLAY
jgi:hypothetical protein